MSSIGIELCDHGTLAAACNGRNNKLVPLENGDHLESPGFASFDGKEFITGAEAQKLVKIRPRQVTSHPWNQLSLRVSNITTRSKTPLYSELAFHHLKHIWQRLDKDHNPNVVTLSLTGDFLLDEPSSDEKIGLLLSMVEDLKIPLGGMLDSACASTSQHAEKLYENKTSIAYHLDLHQHATYITELNIDETVSKKKLTRFSNLGYDKIYDFYIPKLANRFLSETAYDITHDADVEQEFYKHCVELPLALINTPETTIEMGTEQRSRQIAVSRDYIANCIHPAAETIIQLLDKIRKENKDHNQNIAILLTNRLAILPGITESLKHHFNCPCITLPRGAGAIGGAQYGFDKPPIENLEETPLQSSIPLSKPKPIPQEKQSALENDNTSQAVSPPKPNSPRPTPTHITYQGIAYAIPPNGHTVSNFISEKDAPSSSQVFVRHLGDRCILCKQENCELLLNGTPLSTESTTLTPSDTVELIANGIRHTFQLIHLAQ